MPRCPICGADLPPSAGPGSPRQPCGPSCARRARQRRKRAGYWLERAAWFDHYASECRAGRLTHMGSVAYLERVADAARVHAKEELAGLTS